MHRIRFYLCLLCALMFLFVGIVTGEAACYVGVGVYGVLCMTDKQGGQGKR